MQEKFPKI